MVHTGLGKGRCLRVIRQFGPDSLQPVSSFGICTCISHTHTHEREEQIEELAENFLPDVFVGVHK